MDNSKLCIVPCHCELIETRFSITEFRPIKTQPIHRVKLAYRQLFGS